MDADLSFGRWLQRRRRALDLTQAELGRRIGYARVTIHKIETDQLRPSRQMVDRLAEELKIAPADRAEFLRFARGGHGATSPVALPTLPIPTSTDPSPPGRHNLPAQLTGFVGRERELGELRGRLSSARLLTLTGTGGCGKTRLALQVAAERIHDDADGVWLAELAALADPGLVPQAIAAAVGVREVAGQPMRATLRARRLLLVLDNCEHLRDACAELADAILRACPGIQILATSRQALGIAGEVTWRVPSLSIAPTERAADPTDPDPGDAVRLFVDRAVAAEPSFVLDEAKLATVAQICRRLDGIPLAIELAATRVAALSVEQIASLLDRRFRLLAGGSPAALPRQRTLEASIGWSYDLLTEPERALFARLSVFAGGFTLEAAEAVCSGGPGEGGGLAPLAPLQAPGAPRRGEGNEGDGHCPPEPRTQPLAPDAVLGLLLSLIDKSLIVAEVGTAGAERYRLLESLRQYARERLIARRELEQVTCRHAVYFRDRAVEAAPHLLGPDQAGWFDRLERDHDNFRAALRWAIEREDADTGIRLAASLHYFWFLRGHFREGQAIHAAMLDLPAPPHLGALRAELLRGLATLALFEADYARARAFADEGVRLARQAGEPGPLAATLVGLGYVARVQGDYPAARSALEEALALAQDAGDSLQRAMALHHLGLLELEDGPALDVALALSQESLALFRQLGNRRFIGNVLAAIARVMRARGDTGAAPTLLLEALTRFVDIGDLGPVPSVLYTLAAAAADEQRLERAVRLQAAATRVEETVGARVWPAYRRERDTWLGRARAELGEAAFGQAWAAGLAMTPEQTLAEALDAPRVET